MGGVTDHDPLCPWLSAVDRCRCDMIGEVRADERERIAQAIEDNPGPDPSPASPAWWAGWGEGQSDAARIDRGQSVS